MIEAVGGPSADIKATSTETLVTVSDAARELRPQGAPKLTYIYTSGIWVHGDNRTDVVTDTTPITSSAELVAWRPSSEQAVINDRVLNGIVIRPALVYGRSGSLLAPFFKSASEGRVWHPGTPGGRFSLIHVDDCADLYVKAVEKSAIAGGLIFDVANDQTESVDDFLAALVKVSGAKTPYEYRQPTSGMFFGGSRLRVADYTLFLVFEKAFGTTVLLRPYLARAVLGWRPSKPGLVDGLSVYYNAWKADPLAPSKGYIL